MHSSAASERQVHAHCLLSVVCSVNRITCSRCLSLLMLNQPSRNHLPTLYSCSPQKSHAVQPNLYMSVCCLTTVWQPSYANSYGFYDDPCEADIVPHCSQWLRDSTPNLRSAQSGAAAGAWHRCFAFGSAFNALHRQQVALQVSGKHHLWRSNSITRGILRPPHLQFHLPLHLESQLLTWDTLPDDGSAAVSKWRLAPPLAPVSTALTCTTAQTMNLNRRFLAAPRHCHCRGASAWHSVCASQHLEVSCSTRHLGGESQRAQGLARRQGLRIDVHEHQRFAVATQAWLQPDTDHMLIQQLWQMLPGKRLCWHCCASAVAVMAAQQTTAFRGQTASVQQRTCSRWVSLELRYGMWDALAESAPNTSPRADRLLLMAHASFCRCPAASLRLNRSLQWQTLRRHVQYQMVYNIPILH
jgi:hypothetical protein